MTTPEARLMRWRTGAYAVWAIIGGLLLVAAAGYAIGRIAGALAPFVVAFIFVFALQAPVSRLSDRGVPRGWAVAWWFVAVFVVVSLAIVFVAPVVGKQLAAFAAAVPQLLETGRQWMLQLQEKVSNILVPNWLREAALSIAQALSSIFVRLGNSIASGVLSAGSGVATLIFDLFIATVIAFWTLKDLPTIREELRVLAGEKYEEDLENLLTTIGRMVGGYLRGQTIASLCTGTIAGIGLAIIGVPYAAVLGIITFVFNYVPYIGPFFAGLIAAVLGLFVGPWTALGAVAVVVVAQNLVDALITPRVMSDQVDLHPTLVIFSLLIGGSLFGFWGMVLSIPVAATGKALFVYYWERRNRRQLATEDGALFKAAVCEDGSPEPCETTDESPDA